MRRGTMTHDQIWEQEQRLDNSLCSARSRQYAPDHSTVTPPRDTRPDRRIEPNASYAPCSVISSTPIDRVWSDQEGAAEKEILDHTLQSLMEGTKPQRKVGRPIQYFGDPSAPDLTSLERKTLARRIANRKSARHVRARRQEELDNLVSQAQANESKKEMLMRRVREVEYENSALEREVTMVRSQVCLKNCEGDELRSELADLKNKMMALQEPKAEASRQEHSWLPYPSQPDTPAHSVDYGDDKMLPPLWELFEDPDLAVS